MSKLNHNIAMCKVVASKAATLLLCLLASCIFLRAQEIRAGMDSVFTKESVDPDTVAVRKPILGVGTNALYDLAITPNVAVEFPF